MRRRFWFETGTALLSGLLAGLTLFWRDWIEVTGWDPDQHSGALEWLVAGGLAAVALGSAVLARSEWRRRLAAA
jgi:hypothetical protein